MSRLEAILEVFVFSKISNSYKNKTDSVNAQKNTNSFSFYALQLVRTLASKFACTTSYKRKVKDETLKYHTGATLFKCTASRTQTATN